FDVFAWNADCTNATLRFVADASDAMYGENRLATPNAFSVLGTPVDLNKVTCPTFHVGGGTDHITPWRPCYMTTQALGGHSELVVTSTGHVQTIVNPPGKPRARYFAGPGDVADADDWMKTATEHSDSWWPYWADWLVEHSGPTRRAPSKLGNRTHRAGEPAPG